MRIIAGEFKGRRLTAPPDNRVRPTTDKVKEAIFSMISAYLSDSVVVDMFAGTGNLGLEAISRGARKAYFVDRDRASIALVKENVEYCRAGDRSVILAADFTSAVSRINEKADVIFLDPPYKAGYMEECISLIGDADLLAEDGIIVAEHSADDELPESISVFIKVKDRMYGKICVSLYEKQEEL